MITMAPAKSGSSMDRSTNADVAVASGVGVGVLIDEGALVVVGVVGGGVGVDVSAGVFVGSDVGVLVAVGV